MKQCCKIYAFSLCLFLLFSVFIIVSVAPLLQQAVEPIDEAIGKGYRFLVSNLWDEERGAYRECPPSNPEGKDKNYWGDDNYLAYIFHSEYPSFKDETKAQRILLYLRTNPPYLERGKQHWVVLSRNYTQFSPYNDNEYADKVALDGIYYAKSGAIEKARERFNYLILKMYNSSVGLIEDKATLKNGHEYYKLGLALILAVHLKNSTYAEAFVYKLLKLQRADGSWLTDDLDQETTYPNTETTIIILIALTTYQEWCYSPPPNPLLVIVALVILALCIYVLFELFRRRHK